MTEKRGLELYLTGCANAERRHERIESIIRNRGKRRKRKIKRAKDKPPMKKRADGKEEYHSNTLFTAVRAVA